jgi:hypothetical protein
MASVNPEQQSDFQQEAGSFLSIMDEMAPQVRLDYSVDSLQRLEQFINEHFDPPGSKFVDDTLLKGIGCYVGEVIIRHLGGHWNEEGKPEINDIGAIEVIYPIEKTKTRFESGRQESLAWYYHSIAKQAYEADLSKKRTKANKKSHPIMLEASSSTEESGFIQFFRGLFGKS